MIRSFRVTAGSLTAAWKSGFSEVPKQRWAGKLGLGPYTPAIEAAKGVSLGAAKQDSDSARTKDNFSA
jgi:hypothetical protein